MGDIKLPAQDIYVGANKVINSNGSLEDTAQIEDLAVTAGKLAANAVETAKIKDANVTADKLATNAVTTVKIAAANVTLAKLAATANTRVVSYQVEDLDADADIADRAIFEVPTGVVATITKANIISQGTPAGIDDSNTCVITLKNGANTLVTKTYNTGTAFPANNTSASLGSIDGDHEDIAAGGKLLINVTNGSTADPPAFMLQVEYTLADA